MSFLIIFICEFYVPVYFIDIFYFRTKNICVSLKGGVAIDGKTL